MQALSEIIKNTLKQPTYNEFPKDKEVINNLNELINKPTELKNYVINNHSIINETINRLINHDQPSDKMLNYGCELFIACSVFGKIGDKLLNENNPNYLIHGIISWTLFAASMSSYAIYAIKHHKLKQTLKNANKELDNILKKY